MKILVKENELTKSLRRNAHAFIIPIEDHLYYNVHNGPHEELGTMNTQFTGKRLAVPLFPERRVFTSDNPWNEVECEELKLYGYYKIGGLSSEMS